LPALGPKSKSFTPQALKPITGGKKKANLGKRAQADLSAENINMDPIPYNMHFDQDE
jgi:hypothetical protein